MRRRWRWERPRDLGGALMALWMFWGMVGIVVWGVSTIPYDGYIKGWSIVIGVIWVFGAVFVPTIGFAIYGVRWAWRHRPYRVWESAEDMRRAYGKADEG